MSSQQNSNLLEDEVITDVGENIIYGDIIDEDENENENDNQPIDLMQIYNSLNNMNLNELSSLFENIIGNMDNNTDNPASNLCNINNKGVGILNALKPLLPDEKVKLINIVLQLYTISTILRR